MGTSRIEPLELAAREISGNWELTRHGARLRTWIGGHPVRHEGKRLIEHMIAEFMRFPEIEIEDRRIVFPQFLGAYSLFGLQKQFIESHLDNVSGNFAFAMVQDPVFTQVAGPEFRDQVARYEPVMNWLDSMGLRLINLSLVDLDTLDCPDDFVLMSQSLGDDETDEWHRLATSLEVHFRQLTAEERACVVYLHNGLGGALLHSLALISGALQPDQFAFGVAASQRMLHVIDDISADDHSTIHAELRSHANAALAYISAYRAGTVVGRLRELLSGATEGPEVEFKSTLRWDLRLETNSRDVTDSVVKTVAAFLNTSGGTLLIGVSDDRTVVGLEHDQFESDDAFLRHFYTMLTNALGATVAPFVDAQIAPTPGGNVCLVEVRRSPEPVLCQLRKTLDAFFVRTGPATVNLVGEDRRKFQRLHWEKR